MCLKDKQTGTELTKGPDKILFINLKNTRGAIQPHLRDSLPFSSIRMSRIRDHE